MSIRREFVVYIIRKHHPIKSLLEEINKQVFFLHFPINIENNFIYLENLFTNILFFKKKKKKYSHTMNEKQYDQLMWRANTHIVDFLT